MIQEWMPTFLFYLFAVVAIFFAIATVTSRRILRAAVYLMSLLVVSAGFYVLLGAQFLAGVQVLVYVGGIVVLLVFAIMLTRSAELLEDVPSAPRVILGVAASIVFLVSALIVLKETQFVSKGGELIQNTTSALGRGFLDPGANGYVLPFEVVSLLLLAAVIGGIVVARKTPPQEGGRQ